MRTFGKSIIKICVGAGVLELVAAKSEGICKLCDKRVAIRPRMELFEYFPYHLRRNHGSLYMWYVLFLEATGGWVPSSRMVLKMEMIA